MQLVVPSAVSAADAAAIMILSRISPHDDFFIIPSFSQFVHRDTKTQSPLCFFTAVYDLLFTADYADFTDFLSIGAELWRSYNLYNLRNLR